MRHVLIHGHPLGKIKSKGEKIIVTDTQKRRTNNEELNSIRPSKRKQKTCYINMTLVRQKKRNLTKEKNCNNIKSQGKHMLHCRMTRV